MALVERFAVVHRLADLVDGVGPSDEPIHSATFEEDGTLMNTFNDHLDRHPYVPGGRLRLRNIAKAIVDQTDLDIEATLELLDAIDEVVESQIQMGRRVVLPRVHLVTREMLERTWHVGPVVDDPTIHFAIYTDEIVELTGFRPGTVRHALLVTTHLVIDASPNAAVYVPGIGYHGPEGAIVAAQREDLAEELDRLTSAGTSIWLLQCNPDKFDVFGMLDEGDVPKCWSVSRYLDDIRAGDRVVFWISGEAAGVYALGEVVGSPEPGVVDAYHVGDDSPAWDTFVPIDLMVDLWDTPILRRDLKSDPRFAEESIIKVPGAANPHPLSAKGFQAILERITA